MNPLLFSKRIALPLMIIWMSSSLIQAQQKLEPGPLFYQMRDKLSKVQDYVAEVRMKIDVSFMRVPLLTGTLYFKAPGKLKLERNGGISVMPQKSISLSIDKMMPSGNVTVLDAGTEELGNIHTRILKVIPDGETDIVLAKIWVDESRLLALQTETTTRDQGTIRTELSYGKYADLALPDRIVFIMDLKEYKLPKGVTMDYDDGAPASLPSAFKGVAKKGRIEIRYLNYKVNVGLSNTLFSGPQ